MSIHPTAIIEDTVILGENVTIGPYSVITGKVIIGNGTTIYSHCTIGGLGEYPSKSMDEIQDNVGVVIGENCIIRESVNINAATIANQNTVIGNNCYIMTKSHVGHDVVLEEGVVICSCAVIGGYTKIGTKTYVGLNSSIHQRSDVGGYCIIGAQSFFKGESPDGITWAGTPATPKKVNFFNLNKNLKDGSQKSGIVDKAELYIKNFSKSQKKEKE